MIHGLQHPFKPKPTLWAPTRRVLLHMSAVGLPTAVFAAVPGINSVMPPTAHAVCDVRPRAVNAVIIDFTDAPESASQENMARALIADFAAGSVLGSQWLFFGLTGDFLRPLDLLGHICDPGRASEIGWGAWARDSDRQRKRNFIDPLNEAVQRGFSASGQTKTPLIEAGKGLFTSPQFYGADATVPKRFLLITDGMQNTPKANAYRARSAYPNAPDHLANETSRAYVRSNVASVSNVRVTVGFLKRRVHQQLRGFDLKAWIEDYLKSCGVAHQSWVDLA